MSIFTVKGPRRCWRCRMVSMMAQSITQIGVAMRRGTRTGLRSVGREYRCWNCGFKRSVYRTNP